MLIVVLCKLVSEAHSSESFDGQTFYFGDLHAHTGISPDGGSSDEGMPCFDADPLDGIDPPCGSLAGVIDAARDTYHLDFVSFTDHSSTDFPDLFLDLLHRGYEATSSTFVVIPGAERVLRYSDGIHTVGHKTNLVFQDDLTRLETLDVLDFRGETYGQTKKFTACGDVWAHPAAMAAEFGPTLEFAHHPATLFPMATDWTCHDQTYEPVVEVYSGWGNSLRLDDYDQLAEPDPSAMVEEQLDAYRIGFVGGTDIHDTRPGAVCTTDSSSQGTHIYGGGLTIVALPDDAEFKRSAIYGELVARRSLVTTGPEMPVSVHWITPNRTLDGIPHAIGEELVVHQTAAQSTILSVKIPSGGSPDWDSLVVAVRAVGYHDKTFPLTEEVAGEWSVAIPNDQLPKWLYAEVEIDGESFYADVGGCPDSPPVDEAGTVDNREFVWSSPVWFDWGTDLDGDGHAYDVDDCNDYNAAIHPGAVDSKRDPIDWDCDGVR